MAIGEAAEVFYRAYMREGFLTECEDYATWWSIWCMGREL